VSHEADEFLSALAPSVVFPEQGKDAHLPQSAVQGAERSLRHDDGLREPFFLDLVAAGFALQEQGLVRLAQQLYTLAHIGLSVSRVQGEIDRLQTQREDRTPTAKSRLTETMQKPKAFGVRAGKK
jgi:hypothetical protein